MRLVASNQDNPIEPLFETFCLNQPCYLSCYTCRIDALACDIIHARGNIDYKLATVSVLDVSTQSGTHSEQASLRTVLCVVSVT